MINDFLVKTIREVLLGMNLSAEIDFVVEPTNDFNHGDLATNVSLILARAVKQNPLNLARAIAEKIKTRKISEIDRVEVAGPGFINFYLSTDYFHRQIELILAQKKEFGRNNILGSRRTTIEYTDPNPFKEFHIGHLMTNIIGESLACLEVANGAQVTRACYQGDVGLHVAKAIWGAQKMMSDDPFKRKDFLGGFFGWGKRPKVWGQAYAFGATKYEEDENIKKEIVALNKKIYDRTDKVVNKIYDVGRKVSLQEFERLYRVLGTKFDNYFFESEMAGPGKSLVEKNIATGIFEKSDGAAIFKGEDYGLHTRVFVNQEGLPTYEAKELALAKIKYDHTAYDKSIVVTGNEINDYYKVVMKALELIYPELAKKVLHIGHGMLRLPTGKMSSRTGKVISGEFLIKEVERMVLEKMTDRKMSETEKSKVAEIVAIGALKYSILKQAAGSDIIFDFDRSLSFEGDSGPYLQYTCVRAKSVLNKAQADSVSPDLKSGPMPIGILEKLLIRYPQVVKRAGEEYMPHYLVSYLIDLAGEFNRYYAHNKIVDQKDASSAYRVALVAAINQVLENGLGILGIKVPMKM